MKMPIKWHEDCLANMRDSLRQKADIRERLDAEIQRLQRDIYLLDIQIGEAKERRLEGFDSVRFLKVKAKQP